MKVVKGGRDVYTALARVLQKRGGLKGLHSKGQIIVSVS